MKLKKCFQSLAMVAVLLSAAPAFSNEIIGLPADLGGNCSPFGCSYDGKYQQVYTASAFSGPLTISGLEFFNTQVDNGTTSMNSGNWIIALSTTSADWDSLSSTFSTNLGSNNTTVFNGNLFQPWAFGNTLHIVLSTPFTYNPGDGNLLMDVTVSGATSPGGFIYFDTNGSNNPNTIMSRLEGTNIQKGYGLVTGFSTGAPVPEPSTLLLLGSGLMGLAAWRWKRAA